MPSNSLDGDGRSGASRASGLRVNARVIGALLLRESVTRYGRNNIGFLWLFVEPMLFTLLITLLWTALRDVHRSDIPIAAFALTGYSAVLLWRNMPGRCIRALSANRALLFHRQVQMLDVYLARCLLEFCGITCSFFGLGVALWAFGWINPPEDALEVLFAWLLLAWLGLGLAIFLGALSERRSIVEKLWPPMTLILFPLSGAAFMVDAMPPRAQDVLLYLPMLHGSEFLREGFFGSQVKAQFDLWYLISFNLVLTLLGLSQVKRVGIGEGEEL
jgi:ABC-2 type transport system permease protein/capsular polysaccharide transport system permease protein